MSLTWEEHDEHEGELGAALVAFLGVWAVDRAALEEAIAWGDTAGVMRACRLDEATTRALAGIFALHIQSAFNAAALSEIGPHFNPTSPAASRLIAGIAADNATAMMARAEQTVLGILQRGLVDGTSPEDLAFLIEELLWTFDRSAGAVQAQHARMVEEGMPAGTIADAVGRGADKGFDYRLGLVTAAAITAAIAQGQIHAWNEAFPIGLFPPGALVRFVTRADEKVCPRCGPLHGLEQPLGSLWDGEVAPPLHPQCRCHLELTVKIITTEVP